jgi:hypothetical protein
MIYNQIINYKAKYLGVPLQSFFPASPHLFFKANLSVILDISTSKMHLKSVCFSPSPLLPHWSMYHIPFLDQGDPSLVFMFPLLGFLIS